MDRRVKPGGDNSGKQAPEPEFQLSPDRQQVVANAREVLVEKAAGGLGVALEEGRNHGGMLLVILAAQRLRHGAAR